MRVAHWEFWTGLSGDMWVGACLDAGWPESRLLEIPERLRLEGVVLTVETRRHSGFAGKGIRVESGEHHPHRGLPEIEAILTGGDLEPEVVQRSLAVFTRLAEAEARVHGVPIERIHFHEVGALDAIVDIVASVRALRDLGIEFLTAGPIPLSRGEVTAAHGRMPVPAPATALLLPGWPVRPVEGEGEWITPTGAALLATLATPRETLPPMRVGALGMGAGTRSHPYLPNLVRLWIGETSEGEVPGPDAGTGEPDWTTGLVTVLETQVDDMTGEQLGRLAEEVREAGALDVTLDPILMKKGRPGVRLEVVARPEAAERIVGQIFRSCPTLGIRRREERRYERARGTRRLATPWGEIGLKWVGRPDDPAPEFEFEDLVRLSRSRGVPLRRVERDLLLLLAGQVPPGWPEDPTT